MRRDSQFSLRAVLLAAAFAAIALGGTPLAAAEFPFNGGFEAISMGTPLGWKVQGAWFVRSEAAREGRNGLLLRSDFTHAGDSLTTEGYLLAQTGETVTIRLSYQSATGGPAVGLVYCDTFGRAVAQGSLESLPPADTWTTYERTIVLGTDECPLPQGAVRPILIIQQDGVQARLDAVSVSVAGASGPKPLVPQIKAEERPNLLSNPTLALTAQGALPGWTPVAAPGFCGESATVTAAEGGNPGRLVLQGGEQAAAWLSDPVLLDGALPYVAGATLSRADLLGGRASLLLRTLDPQNPRAVWLQSVATVETVKAAAAQPSEAAPATPPAQPAEGAAPTPTTPPAPTTATPPPAAAPAGPAQAETPLQLNLPRLGLQRLPVQAQLAVLLEAGAEGKVAAGTPLLQPEPLSISVRAAASAGGFRRPSDVALFIAAVNNTYANLKPKAYLKVYDSTGTVVVQEGRPIIIGSRSAAYFPYKPKLPAPGEYRLLVRIISAGKDLGSCEFAFKVSGE